MAKTFKLKVITPERIVFEKDVEKLTATARDGQLTILANHEPLVTALGIDVMRATAGDEEYGAAIIGGILEVGVNEVTILTDTAEMGTEIDEARAMQAHSRAEAEKTQRTDKIETHAAELALARAVARMRAAEMVKARKKLHH
ncbi:ATP synthase F1 subunit epsilon [bacterium]|nr:ATP synthase F1 subunit epsilon [bacterium]QQR59375.1 MAG: ATP synthase F1 subunit epsilon [Candidatus Melainabacteria bacterium]